MGSKTWPTTPMSNLFKSTFRGYNKNDWTLKLIFDSLWKINCLLQTKTLKKKNMPPLILCHQCLTSKTKNQWFEGNMPKTWNYGGFANIRAFKMTIHTCLTCTYKLPWKKTPYSKPPQYFINNFCLNIEGSKTQPRFAQQNTVRNYRNPGTFSYYITSTSNKKSTKCSYLRNSNSSFFQLSLLQEKEKPLIFLSLNFNLSLYAKSVHYWLVQYFSDCYYYYSKNLLMKQGLSRKTTGYNLFVFGLGDKQFYSKNNIDPSV